MRYVRHGRPETRDETKDLLARYIREQATSGYTKWRLAGHHGELIGRAGFGARGDDRELGYTIRRDLWGCGLATEAAAALVQWHQDDNGAERQAQLWALAAIENTPSRRILEKLGFAFARDTDEDGVPCALYLLPG